MTRTEAAVLLPIHRSFWECWLGSVVFRETSAMMELVEYLGFGLEESAWAINPAACVGCEWFRRPLHVGSLSLPVSLCIGRRDVHGHTVGSPDHRVLRRSPSLSSRIPNG